MNQIHFSTLIRILIDVLVWLFATDGFAQSSTNDYIRQDVFFIGLDGGNMLKPDTIVKQGFLSDGTQFFIYPLMQKEKSVSIQRAEKDGKNAIIVAGNVNVALTIDSLEALVKKSGGVNDIPLYTEANILCNHTTSQYGRIDLWYQLKPYMTSELRHIGYSFQHSVLVNLVATHINNYFVNYKKSFPPLAL